MPTFSRSIELDVPRAVAWAWHLRPGALARLTPPFESSEILDSGGVGDGARVTVRAALLPGIDSLWSMEHFDVAPPDHFRDRMLRGPFETWEHFHGFAELGPDRTRATDTITWALPFGALGALADGMVRARLDRLFTYRHATLAADLAEHARAESRTLRVAITGASGLLGRQLAPFLTTGGHQVTSLVRGTPKSGEVRWDPRGRWDARALEGYDAVIHLAGEGIADGRWSAARKARIRSSRVEGTASLVSALAELARPPKALIGASAMGIYGDRGDEELTEGSTTGSDFLAEVARGWEAAAEPLRRVGTRVVHLRFGVLLSPAGGALAKMLPPILAGIGGRLGSGGQWMSWLALDDAIYLVHRAILDERYQGPLNAATPTPYTNALFTKALGRIVRRPTFIPVPAFALKALFGEMASGTILASQRLVPARLQEFGFEWRYPALEGALRHLLGRS